MMKFNVNLNKLWIGTIIGLLAPFITLIIVQKSNYKTLNLFEFIDLMQFMGIYTKILSLCVIPNLLFFFLFIWRNYLSSARGVLLATFIYAGIVIIYKYAL
ncbi:MAG: hypothetical protein Kow0068_06070 [Marinilabiliales bacterium]